MLSFSPPSSPTALLPAAPIVRQESSSPFDRRRAASEVLPRVYLTDLFTARNETQLSALGITHVISVLEDAPVFPETHVLRKLHIPLPDSAYEDILAHLPTTTSFIRDALAESPDSRVMVSETMYRIVCCLTDRTRFELGSLSHGHQSERNCRMRVPHRHGKNDS
jgi:atypical dual specificity phosphatase